MQLMFSGLRPRGQSPVSQKETVGNERSALRRRQAPVPSGAAGLG